MVLIQEGQRPNLKNCWCYTFQKALDLSALLRLISSFSNSPTKAYPPFYVPEFSALNNSKTLSIFSFVVLLIKVQYFMVFSGNTEMRMQNNF